VFQAIVMSARKLKRALSEGDQELPARVEDVATAIAQAFVAGKFADVYQRCTATLQGRTALPRFVESWEQTVRDRGNLTGFEVSNAGAIDLHYIPGLEDVRQDSFCAFIEVVFSTPAVPLDDEKAFAVGIVLLESDDGPRIGAIHTR
jgi:hypothetical protein